MKVKNIRIFLINTMLFALVTASQAQLGVNLTGSPPDASAMLDVTATDKGLLLPRVALTSPTDVTTISSPATSLIVFNTNVTGTPPNDLVKAVYYWDGSRWKVLGGNMNHYIGEKYGGGKVFYIFDGGMHGLIADTVDLSTSMAWRSSTNAVTNAIRDGFYAGQYNTDRIITILSGGTGSYAAQTCASYQGGGFSDWYLPSTYELNLLYLQKTVLGGFANAVYWGSVEYSKNDAYGQDFSTGSSANYLKTTTKYVRAIRSF
jgi:hypothetical protein